MTLDMASYEGGVRLQRSEGTGRLGVARLDGRTRIARLYQKGAAKIRVPRLPVPELEAVLINTSGGLTGGDRICWDLDAGPGTHLTLTTQACEKVYRTPAGPADVTTAIRVSDGARADWLPQETILFDRSGLDRVLDVDLAGDAEFMAVEPVILGRTGMGETVNLTRFHDRWRIRRGGRLIHAEDTRLAGDIPALAAHDATLGGGLAFATLFYAGPRAETLSRRLGEQLSGHGQGLSCWDDKLVVRLVAGSGHALRTALVPLIETVRSTPVPRIWHN